MRDSHNYINLLGSDVKGARTSEISIISHVDS